MKQFCFVFSFQANVKKHRETINSEKTYINANMLYLLNLMHFQKYTSRTDSAQKQNGKMAKCRASMRQTKIKVTGKKGLTGIKLIADGFSLKRSAQKTQNAAANITMPGMESEVKSNSK
jgi:hypothetical protein